VDTEEIAAIAGATEEVAMTTGKAIDLARDAGRSLASFFSGPASQVSGMIEDHLRYVRWERSERLAQRAQDFLAERGMSSPTRAVPVKFAIPLIEAATLEEDDTLQDVWARMLANAATDGYPQELNRSFIVMLEQMSGQDVLLFQKIYSVPTPDDPEAGIKTEHLPASVSIDHVNTVTLSTSSPSPAVRLSLANLERLGCLRLSSTFDDSPIYGMVFHSELGRALYEMCEHPVG
jgi:hypothetical protein